MLENCSFLWIPCSFCSNFSEELIIASRPNLSESSAKLLFASASPIPMATRTRPRKATFSFKLFLLLDFSFNCPYYSCRSLQHQLRRRRERRTLRRPPSPTAATRMATMRTSTTLSRWPATIWAMFRQRLLFSWVSRGMRSIENLNIHFRKGESNNRGADSRDRTAQGLSELECGNPSVTEADHWVGNRDANESGTISGATGAARRDESRNR